MQSKLLKHSIFLLSCFFINTIVFAQPFMDVGVSGTIHMYGGLNGKANYAFRINNGSDDGGRFRVDENGRVSIGIGWFDNQTNPAYVGKQLIVAGKTYMKSSLEFAAGPTSFEQIVLYNDGRQKSSIRGAVTGITYVISDVSNHRFVTKSYNGIETESMRIESGGHVGIGTVDPGSYKLAVEGTIGARAVEVKAGPWADFVFDKNYKLRPLKEVESFITAHQHLPDVPSEKEIKEKGINVANMDATLLQKIEELTLYAIEQNKRMEEQDKRMKAIEKENALLKEKLNKQ